jgi:hypothetical protein
MANFDQREQTVTHQYNADVVSFGDVTDRVSFLRQIENVSSEITRVTSSGAVDPTRAMQVQRALEAASLEGQKAEPSTGRIRSLLQTAIMVAKGVTSLEILCLELQKASELTHKLF